MRRLTFPPLEASTIECLHVWASGALQGGSVPLLDVGIPALRSLCQKVQNLNLSLFFSLCKESNLVVRAAQNSGHDSEFMGKFTVTAPSPPALEWAPPCPLPAPGSPALLDPRGPAAEQHSWDTSLECSGNTSLCHL